MEVFEAAENGDLSLLKDLLDHKPEDEVKMSVSNLVLDCSPLLIACRNGHTDVVEYLIEECHADTEKAGRTIVYCDFYEDSTPLWCAARCGHMAIVKILIKHKVSVNNTTTKHSDALRAACIGGDLDIVKYLVEQGADVEIANQQGYTCLMAACSKGHYEISSYLLDCGVDVNRRSITGNTALHDCGNSGSLEIFQNLLKHGAKIAKDEYGNTPILLAAAYGHVPIVTYLFEEQNCTEREIIMSLELMGCAFVDVDQNNTAALECWKWAQHLRSKHSKLALKENNKSHISKYLNTRERLTLAEFESITDPDEVRTQSLVIRERILGLCHPATVELLKDSSFYYECHFKFERCAQLLIFALDLEQCLNPLSFKTKWMFQRFLEMLLSAEALPQNYPTSVLFRDISRVFERSLRELKNSLYSDSNYIENVDLCGHIYYTENIALHFLSLMYEMKNRLSEKEKLLMKEAAYNLVNIYPRKAYIFTVLHLACSDRVPDGNRFISQRVKMIELMLEVGASLNALDIDRNTPLHIAALSRPFDIDLLYTLLKKGAHLDFCNSKNETVLNLVPTGVTLDIYPLQHLSLQCLCAQAIKKYKISYKKSLHRDLRTFIDRHSTHC